jgi:Protein of unknown function (DUF2569)
MEQKSPKGIGGWLILVLLGLILSPLRLILMIYWDMWPLFSTEHWDSLTSPDSASYHPLWNSVLIFEVAGNVTIFLLGLVALLSFLRKRRWAPRLVILCIFLNFVFAAADTYLIKYVIGAPGDLDFASTPEPWVAGVTALIWIPYFLISKRVKATFVN